MSFLDILVLVAAAAIPKDVGRLSALKRLRLGSNKFSGAAME